MRILSSDSSSPARAVAAGPREGGGRARAAAAGPREGGGRSRAVATGPREGDGGPSGATTRPREGGGGPSRATTVRLLTAAAVMVSVAAVAGGAATRAAATTPPTGPGVYITGAGFGHGVGMSQYGAAGYAAHGYGYQQILAAYYSGTTLGTTAPGRRVTVLLRGRGGATFTGATRVQGSPVQLRPATRYSVRASGQSLRLISGGATVGIFAAPLTVLGRGPLRLLGKGLYRGALVFTPSTRGGVMTVNSVGLENYVRGVVSAEMPASWPQQALDAQAVAARTYAITAGAVNAAYDLYDNSRSQMYRGVAAETPATNAAVAATRGQVVEYGGVPVTTYFFASSGGETESVQNVWSGDTPDAWLVSEPDPYDDSFGNPYDQWSMHFSLRAAARRLGHAVHGALLGIRAISRGVSPRIVQAQVIGSRGTTLISGARLQADLGTPSTWMSLTTISAGGTETVSNAPPAGTTAPPSPSVPPVPGSTVTATTPTTAAPPPSSGGTGLTG